MFATIDSPAITPDNYVIPPEKTFRSPLPPQTKNNDRFRKRNVKQKLRRVDIELQEWRGYREDSCLFTVANAPVPWRVKITSIAPVPTSGRKMRESCKACLPFKLCPQGLTTELTANSNRIAEINSLADQLIDTDHRHSAAVKKRRKDINDM